MKNVFKLILLPIVLASLAGCGPKGPAEPAFDGDLGFGTFPQSENGDSATIGWDIIYQPPGSRHDKEALVISHYVLAPMAFDTNDGWNYKESSIRAWLNGEFYNNAFTAEEKAKIMTTTVDNSAESTGDNSNQYVCANTNDKIFLLSYLQVTNRFQTANDRRAKPTAYAVSQGIYPGHTFGYSMWWIRSADPQQPGSPRRINNSDGTIGRGNSNNSTMYGVRPAMWISLE